jgi:hypothetical protein
MFALISRRAGSRTGTNADKAAAVLSAGQRCSGPSKAERSSLSEKATLADAAREARLLQRPIQFPMVTFASQ